jgi:CRISPR-associated protein Cmr6
VSFLAVPAGSGFNFHVLCRPDRLPEALRSRWRNLLDAAFDHAFEWLGFGAKTAVGYGAMGIARSEPAANPRSSDAREGREPEALPRPSASELTWEKAQLKFNPKNGTLTAVGPGNAQANAIGEDGTRLLASLPPALQQKVKQNQFVRVIATVRDNTLAAIQAIS